MGLRKVFKLFKVRYVFVLLYYFVDFRGYGCWRGVFVTVILGFGFKVLGVGFV